MKRRYLSDFNSPAPRAVPLSVRLRVLFGGFNNQFGWIFFGFGLIFVWVFALHADVASLFLFRFQTNSTQGIVETVQATNASEDDVQIYEVRYAYFDNLGRQQKGVSFTTGTPGLGTRVNVEYLSGVPSISRVEGMRRTLFGPWAVFPIIFPMVGLAFLYSGVKHGLKANRLLTQGRIAFGKLVSSESTNVRINDRPVIKLTFSFRANDGDEYEVMAKTHQPEDLRDEEEEPLLYDEKDPSYAVLLDELPGSTEFDSSGKLLPAGKLETATTLILPGLTLFGHVTYLLITLLR
jgi:hypothetical protein